MSGKRQLFCYCKYADPLLLLCFNLWLTRQDEGCFREIHLPREGLHLLIAQTSRIGENRQRISRQGFPRENIKLHEFVTAGHISAPISQLLTLTSTVLTFVSGHVAAFLTRRRLTSGIV